MLYCTHLVTRCERSHGMPDDVKIKNKLQRQLTLLAFMIHTDLHSPYDVKSHFRYPNSRAWERDFKDLREAGVIRIKYRKKDDSIETFLGDETENDNYQVEVILEEGLPEPAKKDKHLSELHHLAKLLAGLPQTDFEELYRYERDDTSDGQECEEEIQTIERPVLADAIAAYQSIYPEADEADRERDFDRLNQLGFYIKYSENYKGYIVDIRFCSEERHFYDSPRGMYLEKLHL